MDKKAAARKAASKHHANRMAAVIDYAKSTDQLDRLVDDFDGIQEEMLGLLPLYRHPAVDAFQENFKFYQPCEIDVEMTAHVDPPFMDQLKLIEIDPGLLNEIEKYVKHSETRKTELEIENFKCKARLDEIEPVYQAAWEEYNNEPKSSRGTRVFQALRFSDGKKCKVYDGNKIFKEYISLLREKGLSRMEALLEIREKYMSMSQKKRVSKNLSEFRDAIHKQLDTVDPNGLANNFKVTFKGCIPTYFPDKL